MANAITADMLSLAGGYRRDFTCGTSGYSRETFFLVQYGFFGGFPVVGGRTKRKYKIQGGPVTGVHWIKITEEM